MLTAFLNNEIVIASNVEDKSDDYTCRCCGEKLILKKGNIKIHHFAHQADSMCVGSEGETPEHELTKLAIYNRLMENDFWVQMEYPIVDEEKNVNRRADILFHLPDLQSFADGKKGTLIAVEIQHSNISEFTIMQRTRDYNKVGIPVIWVIPDGDETKANNMAEVFHKMHNGILWVSDPEWKGFVKPVRLEPLQKWVEPIEYYIPGGRGAMATSGGYYKTLKKKALDFGPEIYLVTDLVYRNAKWAGNVITGQLPYKDRWF
jgi:Competence protein CoiA-like family